MLDLNLFKTNLLIRIGRFEIILPIVNIVYSGLITNYKIGRHDDTAKPMNIIIKNNIESLGVCLFPN